MPHVPKPKWEIDPSSQCPCGSGLPYRKCCRPNAPLIGKSQEFFDKEDYPSAERAVRTELTQYVGWVFQHTIPLLRHLAGPPVELIQIDIDALEESAERLAIALEHQGKKAGIIHTFENLTATVPLPGLDQRMAYLACLWLLEPLAQPHLAEKVLAKWPSSDKIHDRCLLQIFLDIRADELSPAERIAIVDRILERAKSHIERLHYANLKAMLTVVIGEDEEATRIHDQAMGAHFAAVADAASSNDFPARWACARALELQGMLHQDKTAYERALTFLSGIAPAILTPKGKADLAYYSGRLNLMAGNPAKAAACYTEALAEGIDALPLMYRLEAFVRTGELEQARADLEALRGMEIPPGSRLEFLRSAASYAVSAQDLPMARALAKELKALDPGIMHFRTQRESLRAALLEFIDEERSKADAEIKWPRLQAILAKIRAACEYLELKPNFCGLGLNLNRVLEPKAKNRESG